MNEAQSDFNWIINEAATWPPRGHPAAPFGPTALEVLRSCPLRSCFEASRGYERRIGYAARVGMAFHRTLQSLAEKSIPGGSDEEVLEEARRRFQKELEVQDAERAKHPRERGLPRDEVRVNRAIEAIMVEALRLACANITKGSETNFGATEIPHLPPKLDELTIQNDQGITIEVEIPVKSRDGLLQGRIDCVEHLPEGTRLLDYKSALRDDLPERYERQLQIYALLWYETRGEWVSDAQVIYPFTDTMYRVSVEPEICERVGTESRMLVSRLHRTSSAEQLATPGDVCKACEFRPWCKPFWKWQSSETSHLAALRRAALGFEGEIISLDSKDFHWKLHLRWRNCTVRIVAPIERFPQLRNARVGMRIRALEMRLHGQQYQPQAIVTEISELFLLG